jgi:hypothetical protein
LRLRPTPHLPAPLAWNVDLQALRLVDYKLHRLEHHLTVSGRMLNDLRRLRRLLLDEASDLSLAASSDEQ